MLTVPPAICNLRPNATEEAELGAMRMASCPGVPHIPSGTVNEVVKGARSGL